MVQGQWCNLESLFAGLTFVAQFFLCRVVIANYYWSRMISAVAALETKPVSCHLGMTCVPSKLNALPKLSSELQCHWLCFLSTNFAVPVWPLTMWSKPAAYYETDYMCHFT